MPTDAPMFVGLQGDVKQIGWITGESLFQLRHRGGNGSRNTVPIHANRSNVAKYRVYVDTEVDLGDDDER